MLIIGGVAIAAALLIAGGLFMFGAKRAPLPMRIPAEAPKPSPPAKSSSDPAPRTIIMGPTTSSPDPAPRARIVVTELSPGVAKIAIQQPPATGEIAHGKASIGTRGVWPEPIDGDLGPALVALADTAGGDSIALAPSPALAPRCWESTLYSLAPSALIRPGFHRILPVDRADRPDPRPALIEADGSLKTLLEHAWQDRPGIIHVVRRLSRTRQGNVQLTADFGRDLPALDTQPVATFEIAGARLLIMQCDPSMAEIATRASTSEPELAREYALGTLRLGSACGLVIPSIPAQLLEEFTRRMVAGVGACTRSELIEAVRDLRTYLREQDCALCELTLFLREGHLD